VAPASDAVDGFWLPRHARALVEDADFELQGIPGRDFHADESLDTNSNVAADQTEFVVRWPRLDRSMWRALLNSLEAHRAEDHPGSYITRWSRALSRLPEVLMDQISVLDRIARFTGFRTEMFVEAFTRGSILSMEHGFETEVVACTWRATVQWEPMPGDLPGFVRFFPAKRRTRWLAPMRKNGGLFRPLPPVEMALGFAAGNVPGNGLLLSLLLQIANHLRHSEIPCRAPAIVVRNSRQAPIMAPWVLSAVERLDPELVSSSAMLVWDYADEEIQRMLFQRADLVLAAANDQTIEAIAESIDASGIRTRFHPHGHKVSFDVIGAEALRGSIEAPAHLAALDSVLWDQYGCLSARIHFVEAPHLDSARGYGAALVDEMRQAGKRLGPGIAPRRLLRRAYETYRLLESGGDVEVLSDHEDGFLVVVDSRIWNDFLLRETVNRCTGRVVVVRPVGDIGEVPNLYLSRIPSRNLQTIGIAVGSDRLLRFAEEAGSCGVTAIRPLGRAAFPHLAYSWDGFLPADLASRRPPGHFTTIETEDTLQELKRL
jgi:hypothetical protein